MDAIKIHPSDNVEVLLKKRGEISAGHKVALKDIKAGEKIIKYGFPIGVASEDISKGDWVHVHNVKTLLNETTEYAYNPLPIEKTDVSKLKPVTFKGFRRANGSVGIRNEIWIIPVVGCVNSTASRLAALNASLAKGGVEGVYSFSHPYGCSQTGADHARTRKLLAALCRHPNAGGVLVLHLGCENITPEQFRAELGEVDPSRVKFLVSQEVEDEIAEGSRLLAEIAEAMSDDRREDIDASELVIGMKCGGSDGLSGITANPVVGRFSDLLVAIGGTTVLTEVPEMFGAEGFLMDRCVNEEVFHKAVNMINGFKNYFIRHNEVVYENPSPGNKAGGITTLEDKSCGCVQKGGSAPIMDVIGYGDAVTTKGLNMLYGPGNDLVSATALTAAGAHMVLFTTGRGTPFGAPAPTMKIATNTPLATKKAGWIDFNAGVVADGVRNLDEAGADLLALVLEVASGKKTRTEEKGFREISIFKDGVVL